ncbi:hypothetical protein ACPCYX_31800, partial [Pseudomonas fluorescens]|uniref:hypothetical protein n=1 Tax=Pseudomonas fluorescens TaxID=294 RepID=UPI003C256EE1
FVDVSSANIMLNPGDPFVIGFSGAFVLAIQGVLAPQPANAYSGGALFHSFNNGAPTQVSTINGVVFNQDLTFATFVEVADPPA